MNHLHLSENIIRMRRMRRLTQEELADFLGVTKAAVSKWENGQTMPDILLLPQLAAFFHVTIDDLLGYEAQLSKEQIRRRYIELCQDFAQKVALQEPLEEVWEKVDDLARRYYSCHPLLIQLCVLYLNHIPLESTKEERVKRLTRGQKLCQRILQECRDVEICGDAVTIKAMMSLQLGEAQEVIEALEPVADLRHISRQNGDLLIQAYQMAGQEEKAADYCQIKQYIDLLDLIGDTIQLLAVYKGDLDRCEKMMGRTQGVMELYGLERLHPNISAQYYCQAALVYGFHRKEQETLQAMTDFKRCVEILFEEGEIKLHGDDYFDRLDQWFETLPLGNMAPRHSRLARQSALQIFSHPDFSFIKDRPEFQKICMELAEGGEKYA